LGITGVAADRIPEVVYPNGNAPTGVSARFLLARYQSLAEEVLATAPRERIVTIEPTASLTRREAAQQTLKDLQTRAFRRPVTDEDMDRIMKRFDEFETAGEPYENVLRNTMSAILASPKFLTHAEQPLRGDGPPRVDPYDLASRLSYFIWSSVPDEPLLRSAENGSLAKPEVMEQQVRRMLADPRARALVEAFGLQWLGVDRIKVKPSSATAATGLTQRQLDSMREGAVVFLAEVLLKDKGLLSLVDDDQGGVLALPAVNAATAAGDRTSPPRRGKWVLQTLLGELAPRGPNDSCAIPRPGGTSDEGEVLYAQLAKNRQNANCALCHERLDPIGLALEQFDAIGRKRALTTDVMSVKQTVLAQKDKLARTLVERMLSYALGRPIEPWDRPAVDQICKRLAEENYRSSALILGIAQCFPFNFRRAEIR
jgi:hypothetical protein